jgi:Predicted transcriptional regulators
MTIGKKILELRTQKKLTQKQLSDMCGFSQSALNLWENDRRKPKIESLQKIADVLGVSVSEFDKRSLEMYIQQSQNILNDFSNHPENWVQENPFTEESIPVKQVELLKHYNDLNELGKNKAIERIKELTEIPRYKKEE